MGLVPVRDMRGHVDELADTALVVQVHKNGLVGHIASPC